MGRVPRSEDGIDITRRHTRQIDQQRRRPAGHAVDRTFIVGGSITGLPNIPPARISVDPIDDLPEVKELVKVSGSVEDGTADLEWYLNGTLITGSAQTVTTTADDGDVLIDPPVPIANGDRIKVVITSADASDLEATFHVTTRPA